jgi:hypothetical protein
MQIDQLKRRDFITLLGGAAGVAARGARAAGGEAADHWFPGSERAFGRKRMGRRFGAATARRRDLAHKAATSAWVGAQP